MGTTVHFLLKASLDDIVLKGGHIEGSDNILGFKKGKNSQN